MDEALRRAIQSVGGIYALARALGLTHQAIYQWEKCPVLRVLEIERLTGVPREELRPDVYPPGQQHNSRE